MATHVIIGILWCVICFLVVLCNTLRNRHAKATAKATDIIKDLADQALDVKTVLAMKRMHENGVAINRFFEDMEVDYSYLRIEEDEDSGIPVSSLAVGKGHVQVWLEVSNLSDKGSILEAMTTARDIILTQYYGADPDDLLPS